MSGPMFLRWSERRLISILSNSLPVSFNRHIGLYAEGELGHFPGFGSSISFDVFQHLGTTTSHRDWLKIESNFLPSTWTASASALLGIPSGPRAVFLAFILRIAACNSVCVTGAGGWKSTRRCLAPGNSLESRRNKVLSTRSSIIGSSDSVSGGALGLSFPRTSR